MPTWVERRIATLNARLLAVEEELLADPLRAQYLEALEASKQRASRLEENPLKVPKRRGRPPKVQQPVVCHCGGKHKYLPPDPVLEAWYARYKAARVSNPA